jgi:hypothetical protein
MVRAEKFILICLFIVNWLTYKLSVYCHLINLYYSQIRINGNFLTITYSKTSHEKFLMLKNKKGNVSAIFHAFYENQKFLIFISLINNLFANLFFISHNVDLGFFDKFSPKILN